MYLFSRINNKWERSRKRSSKMSIRNIYKIFIFPSFHLYAMIVYCLHHVDKGIL